jgi:hypothetical protein
MLNVANMPFIVSVVMMNVVKLNVVAPSKVIRLQISHIVGCLFGVTTKTGIIKLLIPVINSKITVN